MHTDVTAQGLLRRACEKHASRPLATFEGETWTYREAWERGGKLASALHARGYERGDRIGVMMSNQLDYFTANFACVRGGFVNVPMNDMLTPDEFEYMLADSGASVAVVGEKFTSTLEAIRSELSELDLAVALEPDPPDGMVSLESLLEDTEPGAGDRDVSPDDLLRLSYTGGTTGKPKGARHTHGVLAMNMLAHVTEMAITHREEILIMTPLPHAAGYMHLGGITQGAHFTITQEFDPERFLSLVEERSISWTFLVPTMIYRVLDCESLTTTDLAALETIVYGAAPITAERLEEALDAFGDVFIQAYGQTEMPDVGMILPKADHDVASERIGSCGQPASMVDAEIIDPEADEIVPRARGEAGELAMRSPYVMDGYHEKPEKTASTLVDGWLRTGDIARMDEAGYVYLLDRSSDMIITGGMNVYTTEVEDALDEHPEVQQVAVIGIPDDDWGEAVHAIVVPETGGLTSDAIREFADDRLADYKKPKSVDFVEEIPTTPYGKVDKKALRDPYWDEEDRQIR